MCLFFYLFWHRPRPATGAGKPDGELSGRRGGRRYRQPRRWRRQLADCVPLRKVSYSDLSPLSLEPILIPGERLANNLAPGESQKNLSRSFKDSRSRSLVMETEKDLII